MKENNIIIKVGIDFGAGRIKWLCEKEEDNTSERFKVGLFPNRYLIGENNNGTGYTVERDNYTIKVGVEDGTPNSAKLKANYDYLDSYILALAKEVKDKLECDRDMTLAIHTLLPPEQFLNREIFRKKLLNFGTIEGVVDGTRIKVAIDTVKIACEGVALLKAMNPNIVAGYDRALIVDAGSSTTDIVSIKKQKGKWLVTSAITVTNVSGTSIMHAILKGVKKEFPDVAYNATKLEQDMYFYNGLTKHNVLDYIESASGVITAITNPLRESFTGGKVLLSGGAGELLKASPTFVRICQDVCKSEPELLDEYMRIFGNAKGTYKS